MRRHWRNHSRSAPVRLPDPDLARPGVYHHHPRLDAIPHHALMSPPATNSSVSEGNTDDEGYSDEDVDAYPMDVDDCDLAVADDGLVRDVPPPPQHTMKGSTGSSSSSDDSVWSRSVSPARGPVSPSGYGPQLHRHAHPRQDQQGHQSPHSHSHSHGSSQHGLYRPSIAAYAISCTDSRVSTALRPAFTSTSSCTARDRDRDRERDRYHARPVGGSGREREREKRHGQGYLSRG